MRSTRKEAMSNGDMYYYTGKVCKNGHVAKRNVKTGACTVCNIESSREANRKVVNTEIKKHSMYLSGIRRLYGLTEKGLQDLMNNQKGCCKICGIDFGTMDYRPSIDHNHDTQEVRGLLCQGCNILVGLVELRGEDHINKVIDYIKEI